MTKSTIAERKQLEFTYDQELKKFLGEFGIKDSWSLSDKQHATLMEDHFYWIDKEENQGYHINDDIEFTKRKLTKQELGIYEHLYYDATQY